MVIKNVTKRASKAMYELSLANEMLNELICYPEDGDRNEYLKLLLDGLEKIGDAQKELVAILAQDNKIYKIES